MRSSVFVLLVLVVLSGAALARATGFPEPSAGSEASTAQSTPAPMPCPEQAAHPGPHSATQSTTAETGPLLAVYEAKGNEGILGCWLMDTPEGRVRITIWKQGHYTYFGRLDSPAWLNRAQGEDAFAVEENDKYPPGVYRGNQYAHDDQGLTLTTPLEIVDQGGTLSYRLFQLHRFEEDPVTVHTMTPCD